LIFDITYYGTVLFKEVVMTYFEITDNDNLSAAALSGIIIAVIALPGYWTAILLIDRVGRRRLQLGGFLCIAILFLFMGLFLEEIKKLPVLFVLISGLTFFFSNAGPNTTTFVISSESFMTEVRSTCSGITAAFAKVGAVIGAASFQPLGNFFGYRIVYGTCCAVAMVGFCVTYLFTMDVTRTPLKKFTDTDGSDSEPEPVVYIIGDEDAKYSVQ